MSKLRQCDKGWTLRVQAPKITVSQASAQLRGDLCN